MNENKKRKLEQAYVLLAWRIFVYLKATPDLLEVQSNREIYDAVREICIQHFTREDVNVTREESSKLIDSVSNAKAASDGKEYFIEQETIELYHPSRERDDKWTIRMLIELTFFNTEKYV